MKVLELLDDLENLLEAASTVPFSGKIMVDRNDVSNLIKEIQILLPDEMKHAKWIKDERNKIIEDARRDAQRIVDEAQRKEDEILNGAKNQFDDILDEHKIVELARQKSEKMLFKAQQEASDIRKNAFLYSYDIIEKAHHNMDEILKILQKNKYELEEYINKNEAKKAKESK
jgi:cell division septum initiation protein DivIVA